MLRTIIVGSRILAQGFFVQQLADGRISVRIGDRIVSGQPANAAA